MNNQHGKFKELLKIARFQAAAFKQVSGYLNIYWAMVFHFKILFMKKIWLFYGFCLLVATQNLAAAKAYRIYEYLPKHNPKEYYAGSGLYIAPGAASLSELANALLQALQANSAEQLTIYLPTDAEIAVLKKQGSEDMKAVLEEQSVADLRNGFETDFSALMQHGVDKTLNWSEMQVAETMAGKPTPKNRMLYPVEMILQTKQHRLVLIVFEAVKINNRYFLFRGIQFKS